DWFTKTLVIAVFIGVSNPISSHALARAAHRSGIMPNTGLDNIDEYAEAEDKNKAEVSFAKASETKVENEAKEGENTL
ncbi:MAG: Na+/H+ antiporter subunit G, partial [Candidatus Marinimicrobia bacterium]|nr:Na+/H+ antiporter subunit G [Candidatus Neomarinimicrobiota bacterium]